MAPTTCIIYMLSYERHVFLVSRHKVSMPIIPILFSPVSLCLISPISIAYQWSRWLSQVYYLLFIYIAQYCKQSLKGLYMPTTFFKAFLARILICIQKPGICISKSSTICNSCTYSNDLLIKANANVRKSEKVKFK